ncbi:glycosyltransferase [Bacillus velezensis]|uniref:glycosyltransferase n=1 Tax=Bacillus velezensis TaxID=492670 RepID=UPI000DC2FFF6|nr:glycosyltransferase [Bacillus velezensis]MED3509505.1 glycosyltransferase [Bacillus velezensis]RAP15253.1 hypothetical protein HS9_00580 [Bacillus velezensis]
MKIAMISSPFDQTSYDGNETGYVVYLLIDELVKRGFEVTVFATSDAETTGRLHPLFDRPLNKKDHMQSAFHTGAFYECIQNSFDIIHNHNWFAAGLATFLNTPVVSTLHNTTSYKDYFKGTYQLFPKLKYVAVSKAQQEMLKSEGLNIINCQYYGIPTEQYLFSEKQGDYLAYYGNVDYNYGIHIAIKVSKRVGIPLKIGGPFDRDYFRQTITPYIQTGNIEYVGELDRFSRQNFIAGAVASIYPVLFDEPFSLPFIESMACGTPVISFQTSFANEAISHGQTGFIVDNTNEMIEAIDKISSIQRSSCRYFVKQHFDIEQMVDGYVKIYSEIKNS